MDVVQRTVIGLLASGRGGERYRLPSEQRPAIRQALRQALLGSDAEAEVAALLRLIQSLGTRLRSPSAAAILVEMIRQTPLALAITKERYTIPGQFDPLRISDPKIDSDQATQTMVPVALRPPPLPPLLGRLPPAQHDDVGLADTDERVTRELSAFPPASQERPPAATVLDLPRQPPPRLDYSVLTQPEQETLPRPAIDTLPGLPLH